MMAHNHCVNLLEQVLDTLHTVNNTVGDFDTILDETTGEFDSTGLISGILTSKEFKLFTAIRRSVSE